MFAKKVPQYTYLDVKKVSPLKFGTIDHPVGYTVGKKNEFAYQKKNVAFDDRNWVKLQDAQHNEEHKKYHRLNPYSWQAQSQPQLP
tara:strand:+ start:419 stop:676 length:258 start_codon:yes stop_codon:yes gene_type:complete